MSKIYFYNFWLDEYVEFDAYITNFQDGIKLAYDDLAVGNSVQPFHAAKTLKREITLSFDVVNQRKEEAIANLIKVNFLNNLQYGVRQTGSTRLIAQPRVGVLYENLICKHNVPFSKGPALAGLRCTILSLDVKMELDSGFYTKTVKLPEDIESFSDLDAKGDPFIFPKLIKINLVMTVALSGTPFAHTARIGAPIIKPSKNYPYRITEEEEGKQTSTTTTTPADAAAAGYGAGVGGTGSTGGTNGTGGTGGAGGAGQPAVDGGTPVPGQVVPAPIQTPHSPADAGQNNTVNQGVGNGMPPLPPMPNNMPMSGLTPEQTKQLQYELFLIQALQNPSLVGLTATVPDSTIRDAVKQKFGIQ